MALVVGGTLSAFALLAAMAPSMVAALAHDPVVMRALGITVGFAGFILGRVALRAAAGARRVVALFIALLLLLFAGLLLVSPSYATWLYDSERSVFVPWVFGVPAVMTLMLSRWRVR